MVYVKKKYECPLFYELSRLAGLRLTGQIDLLVIIILRFFLACGAGSVT